jgi:Peptidase_C39 like family
MPAWQRTAQWTVIAAVSVLVMCIAALAAQEGTQRGRGAGWSRSQLAAVAATLPARYLYIVDHRHRHTTDCGNVACRAGLPAAKKLAGTQQAQVRDYFCGPATVSEMLAQMGVRLNQWAAARELGTTQNGTSWSDASGFPVPRVLNENQHLRQYVAVALPWAPSTHQLRTFEIDLVTDINKGSGVPLAGNAYEVAGGPHLVGNPVDQTIMHWFDIRGYSDGGKVTYYEDSVHDASSIGWAAGVPAYSSLASSTIINILGARGYDW